MERKKKGTGRLSAATIVPGSVSLLGSYNICHSLCMAAIYILTGLGFASVGLPFLFLQDYAIYFWSVAVGLIAVSLFVHLRGMACLSRPLLILNAGIIVASVPFAILQPYLLVFYAIGSAIAVCGVALWLKKRQSKKGGKNGNN